MQYLVIKTNDLMYAPLTTRMHIHCTVTSIKHYIQNLVRKIKSLNQLMANTDFC